MAAEEAKRKRKINIELLLGLEATFLSIAALIVSILQTKIAPSSSIPRSGLI